MTIGQNQFINTSIAFLSPRVLAPFHNGPAAKSDLVLIFPSVFPNQPAGHIRSAISKI
jgi:hypothetical protein